MTKMCIKDKIRNFFSKMFYFYAIIYLFFLSLLTLLNGFRKDMRNNKSIESGLMLVHGSIFLLSSDLGLFHFQRHPGGGGWQKIICNVRVEGIKII